MIRSMSYLFCYCQFLARMVLIFLFSSVRYFCSDSIQARSMASYCVFVRFCFNYFCSLDIFLYYSDSVVICSKVLYRFTKGKYSFNSFSTCLTTFTILAILYSFQSPAKTASSFLDSPTPPKIPSYTLFLINS